MRGVVGFEAFEDGFRAVDYRAGQPCKSGDLNTIRSVGRTLNHLANEDDFVVPLLYCDRVVL